MERFNLRIPSSLKEQLDATGNASAYMRTSAERRLARFREARALLRQAGWKKNELLAVMDTLSGTFFTFSIPYTEQVAASMEDAADLDFVHGKWGIVDERWEELCEQARREPIARALQVVAEEYWSESNQHAQQEV